MISGNVKHKTAVIIGAGPAGLTAAFELLKHTTIQPIVLEKSNSIGGISKTVDYKGNKIDLGGHRFFSKSEEIMNWWQQVFPLCISPENIAKNDTWDTGSDNVFLQRDRLSRIYYLRSFFDYPVELNKNTVRKLGLKRILKIGFSYLKSRLFPIKHEKSLEHFFINRFGKALYETFFKDYTEKVWGIPCSKLSAEWGAQRIKGLSVSKVLSHYLKSVFSKKKNDVSQKTTETSLIELFLYPKYGPGQLWEAIADDVIQKGGDVKLLCEFSSVRIGNQGKFYVEYYDNTTGETIAMHDIDYLFSSAAVKDLIRSFADVPDEVLAVSNGLMHRNFVTVGLLLNKLLLENKTKIKTKNGLVPDNWIYVQEPEVKMGRIQVFNNWSPFMVADKTKVWLGLEYFCNPDDSLWTMPDKELIEMAIAELAKIDIINPADVLDATVLRMENTYPVYYGSYYEFDTVRRFTDNIPNLFLIGRSGMHRYNNSDHSMMTAITAVRNIVEGRTDKSNIWDVNTESDYHEQKK